MSLSDQFLSHAKDMLDRVATSDPEAQTNLRRSVSASYYALFHYLIEQSVALLAPNVSKEINHRIQRWFDHGEMKKICGRFAKQELEQPLKGLLEPQGSKKLRTVASTFIVLQEARHQADYNQSYTISRKEAELLHVTARSAILTWENNKETAEANIFILSLLLWKNWEKERA